jgi:probable FeS assembly SUF system protein SufT
MRRAPVVLKRTVVATQIPTGIATKLEPGSMVIVQQAQDGNFTVMTERGGIARIEGKDADALGAEYEGIAAAAEAERAKRREGPFDEHKVWEELSTVYDPEIPAPVTELGLIYAVASQPVEGGVKVTVTMTLTAPGCGVGPMLVDDVRRKVLGVAGVKEAEVNITFEPPWDQSRMTESARLQLGLM